MNNMLKSDPPTNIQGAHHGYHTSGKTFSAIAILILPIPQVKEIIYLYIVFNNHGYLRDLRNFVSK